MKQVDPPEKVFNPDKSKFPTAGIVLMVFAVIALCGIAFLIGSE